MDASTAAQNKELYRRTYGFTKEEIEDLRGDRQARLALNNRQRNLFFSAVATWRRPGVPDVQGPCSHCGTPHGSFCDGDGCDGNRIIMSGLDSVASSLCPQCEYDFLLCKDCIAKGRRPERLCRVCLIPCTLMCSKCHMASYCCVEHQKFDRKTHKIACRYLSGSG
jgi:hypothetical protein